MEAFVSRKRRRRLSTLDDSLPVTTEDDHDEDDSTDFKLAILASLHPNEDQPALLEALLSNNGSVEAASSCLGRSAASIGELPSPRKRRAVGQGHQSLLAPFAGSTHPAKKALTKKGKTLHLYAPQDIEAHTPCSIIHNFLPAVEADALLHELLAEAPSFKKETFQLFDRTVESPHTMCFYVDSLDEARAQQTEYVYNGSYIADVRRTLPEMLKVATKVKSTVNEEIQRRIRTFYPDRKKLKYQSPHPWIPNAAFVNCYDGGGDSVGYHSDQLTYLGPRAVIGSLSLGVAREFRVRRIVPKDDMASDAHTDVGTAADTMGQISIHLPHNSLLIMHAEMQEEWKHSIAPSAAIDPHPLAGNKRLNITYRWYKESLHPRFTPRCRCRVPAVLRCSQRSRENKGRYMWMCHAGYTPGKKGCGFFEWAVFTEDGEPVWQR
ncbi:hypothetical protein LTR50_001532 [Elasticomyces elasticus]|nr:hypothetical protein LTR50_001532 [Elasticomyces elasticus]